MERIVCDVCGEPAVFHSTTIDNGKKSDSHLCAAHATKVGLTKDLTGMTPTGHYVAVANAFVESVATGGVPAFAKDAWKGVVNNIRGTANIIRRYGRPPSSVAEMLEGMALQQGSFPNVEIPDTELRKKVESMEGLIGFCETNKRMPSTRQEWAEFAPDLP